MKLKALTGLLAAFSIALFSACTAEESESELIIYYPQVTNIGPSMNFISDPPSYHGPTPSAFAVAGVTHDGETIVTDCFTINETSGAITISGTDDLPTGAYAVTVACEAGGRDYEFQDIFLVNMLPIAPESIEASESVIVIPYSELETTDKTVSVILTGESVTIQSYTLIQEEGKEYFKISKDGVISVDTSFDGEFMPGNYSLGLKVVTYAGEAVYENFVTVKITSLPLSVEYPSASGRVESGLSYTSGTPTVKASPESLAFALKAVTPSTDKLTVDATTGVISVPEGNGFEVGVTYVVDLTVSNEYGSADFESVFTLEVVDFINPIDASTFKYAATEVYQAGAFSVSPDAGLVGDELSFEFESVPEAIASQLSIDVTNGTVSAVKGHSIPVGTYEISVKASNTKSSATATLALTVIENPYYFSYIRYGNNIGLANDGTYADQFRVSTSSAFRSLELIPTTDAKAGVELEWSVSIKHQCSGTTIDASTGQLTMSGFNANNQGLVLVTAVSGKGTAGETSVTVPVFFSFLQPISGDTLPITWTPFVIQANPRKGVRSDVPVSIGIDVPANFLIDYRRSFNYYNIAGPDTHVSGSLSSSATGTFIYSMWTNYYTQLDMAVNAGARRPVSYYDNSTSLTQALLYIDASDKSVVVNANKWIDDDNVCANGAFSGQTTYVTNGTSSDVASGTQIFPLWIWFDEKF